jgi:hypothetical protein
MKTIHGQYYRRDSRLRVMVFSTTFKYISAISWRSVLLGEETPDLSQVTDKLDHIMLHQEHLYDRDSN